MTSKILGAWLAIMAASAVPFSAVAQQAPDGSAGTFTLQDENASISPSKLTDRYDVNGLRLGYTSGADDVPEGLRNIARAIWPDGILRFGFDISQQIFTAASTQTTTPPAGDRPYAGVLLGTASLIRDVPDSRTTLSLGLGVVGPWALAEQIQNGFHSLIGQPHTNGWHDQLHNEPAVELTGRRTWRLPVAALGDLEADALPDVSVSVGNVRIYAQSGGALRLGQGLDSDYGATRVGPGPSGGDAFMATRPWAWYVFAGADGQGVAHDITLNGNDFQDSAAVKLRPWVGELEAGVAILTHGTRITYTQIVQTQEFAHQKGGLHQMGALAVSVRF